MAAHTAHRLIALVIAALAATTLAATSEKWWQHGVVYQIYPRSFMDSDGDGIGDLKGIISQLQYLADLGIAAVWLSPIYPSPQVDFGYDISDFLGIDHQYGTMSDFEELVKQAHSLGLKVILDIVPNHSSNLHTWFQQSENNVVAYRDYFVWQDGNKSKPDKNGRPGVPNNWLSNFRFSAWEWSEKRQQYYLHMFVKEQPDLNYRSKQVQDEMKEVFRFWMNKGVDGFRLDTVPHLVESDRYDEDEPSSNRDDCDPNDYCSLTHIYTENQPGTYDLIKDWRNLIDSHDPNVDRVMMVEVYSSLDNTIAYYGNQSNLGANFPFNFEMIQTLSKSSNASDFKKTIDDWLDRMEDWRWPNWVLGNHDKPRVASRYPNMADAMNMISMTLPGTAVTYNGEEIGMEDAFISWKQTKDPWAIAQGEQNYLKVSRDPNRTPMQWNENANAGFSTYDKTWMPLNPDYWKRNVLQQKKASNSHLNIYKNLVKLRSLPTMKETNNLKTDVVQENVLKLTRTKANEDTIVTLVNFGSWETVINSADIDTQVLKVFVASDDSKLTAGTDVSKGFTLPPKSGVVLKTGEVMSR